MLTQEQADDLNLQLHAKEAAEIGIDRINKEINRYVDAIKKVSEMMKTATPEQKERIRQIVPKLAEGYNNAKLKRGTYEDQYWQAAGKVNEYEQLQAQQPVATTQTRRRAIKQMGVGVEDTLTPEQYMTPITEAEGRISTKDGPRYGGGISPIKSSKPEQYMTPVSEATLPGWISTVNGPRYVSPNTRTNINTNTQNMTPITEGIGWMSTKDGPRYGGGISTVKTSKPTQYSTPVSEATLPGWISTVNGPRYVGR